MAYEDEDEIKPKKTQTRMASLPMGIWGPAPLSHEATVSAVAVPQLPFKATHLFIPEEIGRKIIVTNLCVGTICQTATAGDIPGEFFSLPTAVFKRLIECKVLPWVTDPKHNPTPTENDLNEAAYYIRRVDLLWTSLLTFDACKPGYTWRIDYKARKPRRPDRSFVPVPFEGVLIGNAILESWSY